MTDNDVFFENFKRFINTLRFRDSSIERERAVDEFYSDRSRIVFSSAFRRLQQKAQVFSLENNASVRTRLTHTLEVADIGRSLARRIMRELGKKNKRFLEYETQVESIVENACLLHDIGNPPFGHFGESAIKEWASNLLINKTCPPEISEQIKKEEDAIKEAKGKKQNNSTEKTEDDEKSETAEKLETLLKDFTHFDGNPQGLRIITRLYTDHDEHGLNLTYSTLLSAVKYARCTDELPDKDPPKAGYFQSEKELVEQMSDKVYQGKIQRYPLTYIMEAADDIAYCMSDIADGIEKGIFTVEKFCTEFRKEWVDRGGSLSVKGRDQVLEDILRPRHSAKYILDYWDAPALINGLKFKKDIAIPWSIKAMSSVVTNFIAHANAIFLGDDCPALLDGKSFWGKVFATVKAVSRKHLYSSIEAEHIELTGYAVIVGILKEYRKVLELPAIEFEKIIKKESTRKHDLERRLCHLLGTRYIDAYHNALSNINPQAPNWDISEYWLRVHLIVDHVSGMTDGFAYETYQMLRGINPMRN